MSDVPTVTVLVPARNEERDIERCLRAVLAQDHPHDRLEIVLIDGGSADRTVEVATRVLETGDVDWKIVDNPVGTTPSNLNAGLAVATGDILCRVDARSIIPPQYVRVCADVLTSRADVAVVGGAQVAIAVTGSVKALGIARALNNRYAMGGSRYRSSATSGPSDTVYLGAFRSEQLRAAGGWDELFETNQDYELNRRMGRQGIVWFDDRIPVDYVPRQSLGALWRQYHRFGRWKVRYWRQTGDRPRPRQLAALGAGMLAGSATFGLVLSGRRPLRHVSIAGLGLVSALAVVDATGGDGVEALPVRAVAVAANVVVVSGWLCGVARQAIVR